MEESKGHDDDFTGGTPPTTPPELAALLPNLVLQVIPFQANRLIRYIHALCDAPAIKAVAIIEKVWVVRPGTRLSERFLAFIIRPSPDSPDADETAAIDAVVKVMGQDSRLPLGYIRRAYRTQSRHSTLEEAVVAAMEACTSASPDPVIFRGMCFPNPLLDDLMGVLDDKYPDVERLPRGHNMVVNLVKWADSDCYLSGFSTAEQAALFSPIDQTSDAVSRAGHKLEEAYERFLGADVESLTTKVAIDAGAAPGGWSYFMAKTYDTVYAVDPGNLASPKPDNVEHLPIKIQEAVPLLHHKGIRCDAYTCDMNAGPDQVMEIFQSAVSLLAPGAVVVLTMKNFVGGYKKFNQSCRKAEAQLKTCCDDVRMMELLFNTRKETTLFGRVKADHTGETKWTRYYADPAVLPPWDTDGAPASSLVAAFAEGGVVQRLKDGPVKSVLELGCGTGNNAVWLAGLEGVASVTAVDIAEGAVERARARASAASLTNLTVLQQDVLTLSTGPEAPSGLEPFDFLFDCQTYHVVQKQFGSGVMIDTMGGLLRSGGLAMILTGNASEPSKLSPGPVALTAAELVVAFEGSGLFTVESLKSIRFDPTPAYGEVPPLAWELVVRRR